MSFLDQLFGQPMPQRQIDQNSVIISQNTQIIHMLGSILGEIYRLERRTMATFEEVQAAQADTDAKVAAVGADVAALLAKIAAIPAAGMTPEQQAALDDIAAHAGRINDSLSAVDASANPPAG